MIISGKGVYAEESRGAPVKKGDSLFINHLRFHRIAKSVHDLAHISIQFLPSVIEPSVSMDMAVNTLMQFSTLEPFYRKKSGYFNFLSVSEEAFTRILIGFLSVVHEFVSSGGSSTPSLRSCFSHLIQFLKGEYQKYNRGRPDE